MDMHIFSFPSENKTWTLNDLHDSEESPVSVRFGGPSRTRTDNIFLAKEALYHWSYRPIFYSLLVYFTNSEGRGNRTHSVETTSLQPAPALQLRRTHKAFFRSRKAIPVKRSLLQPVARNLSVWVQVAIPVKDLSTLSQSCATREDSGSRTHSVETPDLQSSPALQLRRIHKALFSPEGSTRVFNSTRKLQSLLKEPSTAVKRHASPSSCSTTTSKLGDAGGSWTREN